MLGKTRRARGTVHVPASLFAAQGRSGGPWRLPAPVRQARRGPLGNLGKALENTVGLSGAQAGDQKRRGTTDGYRGDEGPEGPEITKNNKTTLMGRFQLVRFT